MVGKKENVMKKVRGIDLSDMLEIEIFEIDKSDIMEDGYKYSGIINKDGEMLDNFEGSGNFNTSDCVQSFLMEYILKNNLVVITKDNIHLYYEFMSDDDLEKYSYILDDIFDLRNKIVLNELDIELNIFYKISTYKVKNSGFISVQIFDIKDTLKPIGEYIEEIKASEGYKAYVSKNKPLLKCYSIIANGIFYFINKQFYHLNNDDKWELVSSENKINELWELRKNSTEWELVTGNLLESLNKHISTKTI